MKEISAVMASWNRAGILFWSVLSLIHQEIPPNEIIIVDDGSTDGTDRTVKNLQKEYPEANIKYYYNNDPEWHNCCVPINIAFRKATKELILITQPEILHAHPSEIRIILEYFEKGDPEYGDKVYFAAYKFYSVFEEATEELTEENLLHPMTITKKSNVIKHYKGHHSHPEDIVYFDKTIAHYISATPRKYLMEIRGFDERMRTMSGHDDSDFVARVRRHGIKVVTHPDLIPIHLHHVRPPSDRCMGSGLTNYNFHMENDRKGIWQANAGKEWGVLKE